MLVAIIRQSHASSRISRERHMHTAQSWLKEGSVLSFQKFQNFLWWLLYNELLVATERLFIPVSQQGFQGAKAGRWAAISPQMYGPVNKCFPAGPIPARCSLLLVGIESRWCLWVASSWGWSRHMPAWRGHVRTLQYQHFGPVLCKPSIALCPIVEEGSLID